MTTIARVVSRPILYFPIFLAACSTNGQESVARYEIDQAVASIDDEGLAFSEKRELVVTYSKPYTEKYLEEPYDFNSSVFRYRENDGLVVEAVTRISIPLDIEGRTKWTAFGAECVSRLSENKYRIECEGSRGARSYLYSTDLGIVEFDFPCGAERLCKYKLVSDKGIFANI